MINSPDNSPEEPQRFLEIDTGGRRKRLVGTLSYLIFFLAVAAALVMLFIYFTNQWTLAILLVGFMVIYMAFMGWLAMRKVRDNDDMMMR
jgi:fatty acid desaturase